MVSWSAKKTTCRMWLDSHVKQTERQTGLSMSIFVALCHIQSVLFLNVVHNQKKFISMPVNSFFNMHIV